MQFSYILSILLSSSLVSSLDYLKIIEDYAKNVKGFDAITVLSCPTAFKVQSWLSRKENGYLFQFLDISQEWNFTQLESELNCRQLIVLDLNCPDFRLIIEELSEKGQFNTLCRAFLFHNSNEDKSLYEIVIKPILSNVDFTFISNVAYGSKFPIQNDPQLRESSTELDKYYIYDLWNPGRKQGGTLKVDFIGSYNLEETEKMAFHYFDLDATIAPQQRRLNLSELHLECTIVVTSPFNDTLENYLTHSYHPYFDTVHRLNFRTINLVQDYFHFKLHVRRTRSWGYVQNASSATTFDGMVGMVQRGEVDFGCSPAWFRLERTEVIDYGAQTWAIRPIFLFRHPSTRGLGKNVFLEPFDDSVWAVLAVSSVIIILLMANSVQQEKNVLGKIPKDNKMKRFFRNRILGTKLLSILHGIKSFVQSVRIYVSVLLQQGVPSSDEGHLLSTKLAVFLLFVYSFLLFQFYSASIVGSLLMTPPKTIRTISDLTHSRLKVGIQDIVYNYEFFKHTRDENALELYSKKVKMLDHKTGNYSLNFYSVNDGLRKLQYEQFAFHVDLDYVFQRIIDTFNEKDICDLTMIYLYPQQPMGNVFPKGSPFRYVLNYGTHRAIETGLFSREKNFWVAKTPSCTRQIQTEDLRVELYPLRSLFYLLFGGMGLSIGILLLEILLHRIVDS